jgi:hypothetical protein
MTQPDLFGPLTRKGDSIVPPTRDGGIPGRDVGMAIAVDHAEAVEPDWADRAFRVFVAFSRLQPTFITAEVREYAERVGLPTPPTNWAWGSIAARAAREGIVTQAGTTKHGEGRNHQKVCQVWRSAK